MQVNRKYLLCALVALLAASLACETISGINQPEKSTISSDTGNNASLPGQPFITSTPQQQSVPPLELTNIGPLHTSEEGAPTSFDTEFPLPPDIQNFQKTDYQDAGITFQTTLKLENIVQFYRDAFAKKGYTERQIMTSIEDYTISLVFDGAPNGKAIVVQGVDIGTGIVTVNIRYDEQV